MTYKESRDRVIRHFSSKCGRCGFDDPRALQIDHVNGDGYLDRKLTKSHNWELFHEIVLADKAGRFQLLCANCNWIKKSEDREYQVTKRFRKHFRALYRNGFSRKKIEQIIDVLDGAPNPNIKMTYFIKNDVLCCAPADEMLPLATQKSNAPADPTASLTPRQKAKFHIWKKFSA
jgi:hypothetical protein